MIMWNASIPAAFLWQDAMLLLVLFYILFTNFHRDQLTHCLADVCMPKSFKGYFQYYELNMTLHKCVIYLEQFCIWGPHVSWLLFNVQKMRSKNKQGDSGRKKIVMIKKENKKHLNVALYVCCRLYFLGQRAPLRAIRWNYKNNRGKTGKYPLHQKREEYRLHHRDIVSAILHFKKKNL